VLPRLICDLRNIFCFVNSFQKCVLQLLEFKPPRARVRGQIKTAPKPSLDRWECACKILSRSVQGFGFPLTNRHTEPEPLRKFVSSRFRLGAAMIAIQFSFNSHSLGWAGCRLRLWHLHVILYPRLTHKSKE